MYEMNTGDYRDYDNRENYRDDYRRGNYRGSYREDYRRGGRRNNRSYRNYREEEDLYEELEMCMDEAKECSRKYEDLADMTDNTSDRNNLMKISQREKEHYSTLKQMVERGM